MFFSCQGPSVIWPLLRQSGVSGRTWLGAAVLSLPGSLCWFQVLTSGIQKRGRSRAFLSCFCIRISACASTLSTEHAQYSLKRWSRSGSSSLGSSSVSEPCISVSFPSVRAPRAAGQAGLEAQPRAATAPRKRSLRQWGACSRPWGQTHWKDCCAGSRCWLGPVSTQALPMGVRTPAPGT